MTPFQHLNQPDDEQDLSCMTSFQYSNQPDWRDVWRSAANNDRSGIMDGNTKTSRGFRSLNCSANHGADTLELIDSIFCKGKRSSYLVGYLESLQNLHKRAKIETDDVIITGPRYSERPRVHFTHATLISQRRDGAKEYKYNIISYPKRNQTWNKIICICRIGMNYEPWLRSGKHSTFLEFVTSQVPLCISVYFQHECFYVGYEILGVLW